LIKTTYIKEKGNATYIYLIMTKTLPFQQIDLCKAIENRAQRHKFSADDQIIRIGQHVKVIPIVLSGAVDVYRKDEDEHLLFLYTIKPLESCAMTLQSCYSNQPSEIFAVTSIETEILAVPANLLDAWMNEFPEWKKFVINNFSLRFKELLKVIDNISFHNLDERLVEYLDYKAKSTGENVLKLSHQAIANDLNSSREVVSRLLKQLEQKGKLSLGRNKIELM